MTGADRPWQSRMDPIAKPSASHSSLPPGVRHLAPRQRTDYTWTYAREEALPQSRDRAVARYRARLDERGIARFEVLGRKADRDLIRSVARRLAEGSPESEELRGVLGRALRPAAGEPGGIYRALRASPLVGVDLQVSRPFEGGREIDLE
ncbi:hypothetical protein ACTZWW_07165 [Salinarimonas sp. NSM]|uniref:hypothetical protein n=1 Tax=Salinarimonas sp. NSM TaxID=3458003 RepID=UPI004036AD51